MMSYHVTCAPLPIGPHPIVLKIATQTYPLVLTPFPVTTVEYRTGPDSILPQIYVLILIKLHCLNEQFFYPFDLA